MRFELKNARVTSGGPSGSVVVFDPSGNTLVLRGDYAAHFLEKYEEQLKVGLGEFNMHVQIDVDTEAP